MEKFIFKINFLQVWISTWWCLLHSSFYLWISFGSLFRFVVWSLSPRLSHFSNRIWNSRRGQRASLLELKISLENLPVGTLYRDSTSSYTFSAGFQKSWPRWAGQILLLHMFHELCRAEKRWAWSAGSQWALTNGSLLTQVCFYSQSKRWNPGLCSVTMGPPHSQTHDWEEGEFSLWSDVLACLRALAYHHNTLCFIYAE